MSGRPTVIMPLEKLARKPTNEGMKIVKNIWRFDLVGEPVVGEPSTVGVVGEFNWNELLFAGGGGCPVFALENVSSSTASSVLVTVVVAILSKVPLCVCVLWYCKCSGWQHQQMLSWFIRLMIEFTGCLARPSHFCPRQGVTLSLFIENVDHDMIYDQALHFLCVRR